MRVGGNFSDGKHYQLREPLAVLALDQATGKTIWNYTGIQAGLTNLLPLPKLGVIMVAGGETFVGLDAAAATPTPKFTTKLEFKRKMGGVEMAAKGAKVGFGFMSGGIVGGLKGAVSAAKSDKGRLDVPVSLALQADGRVTVRGQQHVAAFDPAKNNLVWSNYFAPPGVNNFAVLAMGVVSVALAAGNTGLAATADSYSAQSNALAGAVGSMDNFQKYASQRFSATRDAGHSVYMLTNVEEGAQKGPGILKIDLASGEPKGQLLLNDKEPKYTVDEAVGRVFYFKGKTSLVAYQL